MLLSGPLGQAGSRQFNLRKLVGTCRQKGGSEGLARSFLGSPGYLRESRREGRLPLSQHSPASLQPRFSALPPKRSPFPSILNELQLYHLETPLLDAGSIQATPSLQNTLLGTFYSSLSLYVDPTIPQNSFSDFPLPVLPQ